MADGATEPARPWSRRIGWGLELLALTGFALTQPILSVFGDAPDVFIFRDATTADILLFAAVVTFVPPLTLWLIELAVSRFSEKARRVVHATFLGVLVVLLAIQVLKKGFSIEGPINLVLSVILGVMVVLLYLRVDVVGMFLRFASLAPIAFALLFVFSSPVSNLVFPSDVSTVKVQPPKNAPSTIMVIFDEWPTSSVVDAAGNVDPSQFPNLARLSNLGTWYRNSSSVSTATYYAVPALLTGNLPKSGDIPDASSHPQNLFTVFGQSYRMEAFESITRLCPRSLCPARSRGSSTGVSALLADARSAYRKMVSPSVQESEITVGFQESIGAPTGSGEQRLLSAEHDLGQAIEGRGDRFAQFLATIKKDEVPDPALPAHPPAARAVPLPPVGAPVPAAGLRLRPRGNGARRLDGPDLAARAGPRASAPADRVHGSSGRRAAGPPARTGLLESSLLVVTADRDRLHPGEPARG